jgi:hypothetical protein
MIIQLVPLHRRHLENKIEVEDTSFLKKQHGQFSFKQKLSVTNWFLISHFFFFFEILKFWIPPCCWHSCSALFESVSVTRGSCETCKLQLSRRVVILDTSRGFSGCIHSAHHCMYPLWQRNDLLIMEELVSASCLLGYLWGNNNLYGSSWFRLNPSSMDCWRRWFGRYPSWSTNEPGPSVFSLLSKVSDPIPSSVLSRLFCGISIRSRTVCTWSGRLMCTNHSSW